MEENPDNEDANFMSDWSGSMTPPLSDMEDELPVSQCVSPVRSEYLHQLDVTSAADYEVPQFECKGTSKSFTNVSRQQMFERMQMKDDPYPSYPCFQNKSTRFFGMKFPTAEGLCPPYRRKLFLLCRQSIFRLKGIQATQTKLKAENYRSVKKSCVDFMTYVHCTIHRIITSKQGLTALIDNSGVIYLLVDEVKHLVAAIGRINIQSALMLSTDEALYHATKRNIDDLLNHVILEINWFYLVILMELCLHDAVDNDSKVKYATYFEKGCLVVMWDLVSIAFKSFTKNRSTSFSISRGVEGSMFPCGCCVEMMVSVMRMADEISFDRNSQGFWSMFSGICSSLQKLAGKSPREKDNVTMLAPDDVSFEEPIAFSWWLLKEIGPLYKFDVAGKIVFKHGMYLPSNWVFVQDLLRDTFRTKGPDTEEGLARESLRSCLELGSIWNPNSEIITYLWEYYHKKLNARFSIGNQGILSTAYPNLSPLQWMEKVSFDKSEDILERITPTDQSTSYELFLTLLAVSLLKTAKTDTRTSLWGQLKGRFYSKFHKKRMEELNEFGLQNFISLFLVLASCIETEKIEEKLCSFLDLVKAEAMSPSMSHVMIRGLYAMCHVKRKFMASRSALTEKLKTNFETNCRNFTERLHDQTARRNFWLLINLHLDCIEEVCDYSEGFSPEMSFLNEGDALSNVFSRCNDSEARRIASFVYRLLSNERLHRNTGSSSHSFLWSVLYPWMQKSSFHQQLAQRIPEAIADVAAGFSLLSVQRNGKSTMIPRFKDLVEKHTSAELPVRFIAKYMSHLLSSSATFDMIVSEDLQPVIIQSWLHCLIFLTDQNQSMQEITRYILLLPDVKVLLEREGKNITDQAMDIVFEFIVGLGRMQINSTQLSEMVQLRMKAKSYFGRILLNTESLLQTGNPPDSLRLLYSLVGKLTKHCSKLIYSKTSPDCLLPKILDQMVLPHQSAKKAIPASVTRCLYGHIHQFLSGLATLDFKKDEFIRRKIREIFSRYFLLILKRCHLSPNSKNPFLVALQTSFVQKPANQASEFRQLVIEIVAESYLVLPQPPDNHSTVLYFILRLLQKSHSSAEIIKNSPAIIMQIMCSIMSCDGCGGGNSEPPGIRRPAMEILAVITQAYKTANAEERQKLLEKLQNVLLLNIDQFREIVFKPFEVLAKLDKELSKGLVRAAKEAVEESEKTRGCGQDIRLRSSLEHFIASTG